MKEGRMVAKLLRNFKVSRFLIMKVHYATQFTQANTSIVFPTRKTFKYLGKGVEFLMKKSNNFTIFYY